MEVVYVGSSPAESVIELLLEGNRFRELAGGYGAGCFALPGARHAKAFYEALIEHSADIDATRNNLAVQINQGYASRRFGPNEAQRLTSDLNKINVKEVTYLSNSGGVLTSFQHARLKSELTGLSLRVNKDIVAGNVWR